MTIGITRDDLTPGPSPLRNEVSEAKEERQEMTTSGSEMGGDWREGGRQIWRPYRTMFKSGHMLEMLQMPIPTD
jgi:hypothetical protein